MCKQNKYSFAEENALFSLLNVEQTGNIKKSLTILQVTFYKNVPINEFVTRR